MDPDSCKADIRRIVDEFGVYISFEKGLSVNTLNAYTRDIWQLIKWLDNSVDICGLEASHVHSYFMECGSNWASSTLSRKMSAIQSFVSFLRVADGRERGACSSVVLSRPKKEKKIPNVPSEGVIKRMLYIISLAAEHEYCGARDLAMIDLLYTTGLRVSELCALKITDISNDKVWVRHGKGGKDRCVPVIQDVLIAVNRYIDMWRHQVCFRSVDALFLTDHGERISRQFVWKRIRHWGRIVGVDHITPHMFRHACATHLLRGGMDISVIQAVLGHSSILSTDIYTHVSDADVLHSFDMYHPRKSV